MSNQTLFVAVFWAFFLLDGVSVRRRSRFGFTSWLGGRRAWPAWRRWHFPSPWPAGWNVVADDLPFSFSPAGVVNWPAGAAARPVEAPDNTQAWRWGEIRQVEEKLGWLVINERQFCPATGHLTAAEMAALSAALAPLDAEGRAALLRARLRGWLRPAHLRRRALVLRVQTGGVAIFNVAVLAGSAALSGWFLGGFREAAADWVSARVGLLLLWLALMHLWGMGLAWWTRRRLRQISRQPVLAKSVLVGALFLPPQALRLRATLGTGWFPPSHPAAVALAFAPAAVRDRMVFNVLADLRWPLAPPAGGPLAGEILAWYRTAFGDELKRLLRREGLEADELLAAPVPDGPSSCAYCPRCQSQFVDAGAACPHGVPLLPLSHEKKG
jgi:hypothetical protein